MQKPRTDGSIINIFTQEEDFAAEMVNRKPEEILIEKPFPNPFNYPVNGKHGPDDEDDDESEEEDLILGDADEADGNEEEFNVILDDDEDANEDDLVIGSDDDIDDEDDDL